MNARRRIALLVLLAGTFAGGALWLALPREDGAPSEPTRAAARDEPARRVGEGPALARPAPADGRRGPAAGPATARAREPAEVRGWVLDETQRPVAGADLVLAAVDVAAVRGVPAPDGERLAQGRAEADGSFAFPAPTTALARLTASAPGRARATAWVDPAGARLVLHLGPEARLALEVVDAEGASVPDAVVEIEAGRALRVVEAPSGRAEIGGLEEGAVRLRATSATRGVGEAGPLDVRAGERREVLLALTPPARIAGSIVDAGTGAGIAGAEVRFARPGRSVTAGPTDAAGRFEAVLAGGVGEALWVSVAAEGYAARLEALTLGPTGSGADLLRFALERADPWRGRVEDASGAPVARAHVAYTPDGVAGRAAPSTTTDEEGRFTLPPPAPPAPGRRVVLTAAGPAGHAALALRPGEPRPEPLVLRLTRGTPVRGGVTDAEGRPLVGVLARLQPAWERLADREGADLLLAVNAGRAGGLTALSGGDGTWVVDDVPPGTWRLALEREGTRRAVGAPFAVAGSATDLGTETWGAGPSVRGRVRTRAGRPVPGASVRAVEADGETRGAATTSGADGAFLLTDLGAGPLGLEARAGPYGVARVRWDPQASSVEDLVLPDATPLTLEASVAGRPYAGLLSITVAARSGAVAQRLSLRMEDGAATIDEIPPGLWTLTLEAPGGLRAGVADVERIEGRRSTLAVALVPGAGLVGRVLAAGGRPVGRGRVHVRPADGGRARAAAVGADGAWHLEGLAAGEVDVTAVGEGGAPVERRVSVRAGEVTGVDLELAAAGGARVRVVDADRRAVAGALLSVRAEARQALPPDPPAVRTGRDGRARLGDLPTGPLLVRARTADGREGAAHVEVRAGEDVEVEVLLGAPAAR